MYLSTPCSLPLDMLSTFGHNSHNDDVHSGKMVMMMAMVQTMLHTSQVGQTKSSDLPAAL